MLSQAKHLIVLCLLGSLSLSLTAQWKFTDVTEEAGVAYQQSAPLFTGVAAGDFDNDGWTDLYVVRLDLAPNMLFRNKGDGTFEEVAQSVGLEDSITEPAGALFVDYDGDGWQDLLLVTGVRGPSQLLRNEQGQRFVDVTQSVGINLTGRMRSPAAGDYDKDGFIDFYMAVNDDAKTVGHLWRNRGDGTFENTASFAGIGASDSFEFNHEFSPTFADINNDGWPDLLVVSDFNNSQHYLNNGDGTFTRNTTAVITDEGGMGSAVGDYDNDGDLDWFVSSIWDEAQNVARPWGVSSGNRLYKNKGDGTFEDATDEAGVRFGYWGWGSSFADFDNDGNLDIFHTNGFLTSVEPAFERDPNVFFHSNGDGTFTEMAQALGLDSTEMGHGIVCFDYDQDGDLDIYIANSTGPSRLFRNDGGNANSWLTVVPRGSGANTQALGSRVYLTSNGKTQMREINGGSNFLSNNPTVAHFGMAADQAADVEIRWPNDVKTRLSGISANQRLIVPQPDLSWDDPAVNFYSYFQHIKTLVDSQVTAGAMSADQARSLRFAMIKGYVNGRFGPVAN